MSKRQKLIVWIIVLSVLNICIIKFYKLPENNMIYFTADVKSQVSGVYQVYYSYDGIFSEVNSVTYEYSEIDKLKTLEFKIPVNVKYVRLDFPEDSGEIILENLKFIINEKNKYIEQSNLDSPYSMNSVGPYIVDKNGIKLQVKGVDPHVVYDISNMGLPQIIHELNKTAIIHHKIMYCTILNLCLIIFLRVYNKFTMIIKVAFDNRKIIKRLAINDFKTKYAGSYLGIIWAFIQPIITILVYWFVFEIGFKTQEVNGVPYVLWLTTGLIPWFYFQEAWIGGSNSLIEYSYLVKKVVFKISILPVVKIVSSLFVHLFFISFVLAIFIFNGYYPNIYNLQVIYYGICMIIYVLGLSYITSAVIVFFRDLSQIINIILQIGMWMTPILWNNDMVGSKFQWILKLNPVYYIINGYRDSFINQKWFWESINWTIYFWIFASIQFIIGMFIFKKLKLHFADVL